MADKFNINVDNEKFNNSLDNYVKNRLKGGTEKGIRKACMLVEGTAKELSGFDTGHLSASITHEVEIKADVINGIVGTNVSYSIFHHEGTGIYAKDGGGRKTPWVYSKDGKFYKTVGQKPNPFLKNAIEKHKNDIIRIIKENY